MTPADLTDSMLPVIVGLYCAVLGFVIGWSLCSLRSQSQSQE